MLLFEFENDDLVLETDHDFQGLDFVFYDKPFDHYSLKSVSKRIQSFDELEYYAEVLLYLNPDIEKDLFIGIFRWLGSRDSKKSIRTYTKHRIEYALEEIFKKRLTPFCRRPRRVIFNPEKIISTEEKIAVAAHIVKRSASFTRDDVYKALLSLRSRRKVATTKTIAKELLCSPSTVSRILDNDLKQMIKGFNSETRKELKIEVLLQNIELLTSNGDSLKVRALKEMTSIRDYKLIKEAIGRYLEGH